jgi:aminoglycoside phosphotransferase (APT) family kinase protein
MTVASQTSAASPASPSLDAAALDAYLTRHVADYRGPLTVEHLAGGQSNPTFRLNARGRRYVLRKKPSGPILPSAHAVDREHRVISALYGSSVPVPKPICYCDDARVIGTAFYVMDFVEGRIFRDPSLPGLTNAERGAMWDDFNRVIAALHTVNWNAIGLSDFGRPGNYFERQIGRWTKQYRASETASIPAMDRLIDWLPGNIPPGDESAIVHGDLRIDNMIYHPTEPRIVAMLDWELSTIGHPLADLSYHAITWHLTQAQFRGMAEHDLAALGIPSEHDYVRAYCRRVGREPIDTAHWRFALAFSMFRLAAILQGITRRALDGTAASADAIETGKRAALIADAAWQQVESLRGGDSR